jgi:hypothetical protein
LEDVDQLRWTGMTDVFPEVCKQIDATGLLERAKSLTPA